MTLPNQYIFSTYTNRPRHTGRADIVIGPQHKMNTNCSLPLPRLHGQSSIWHPQAAANGTVHTSARAMASFDQYKFPCETPVTEPNLCTRIWLRPSTHPPFEKMTHAHQFCHHLLKSNCASIYRLTTSHTCMVPDGIH